MLRISDQEKPGEIGYSITLFKNVLFIGLDRKENSQCSFWMPLKRTSRPSNRVAQTLEPMAAVSGEDSSTAFAAAAVDGVLMSSAVGRFWAMKSRH